MLLGIAVPVRWQLGAVSASGGCAHSLHKPNTNNDVLHQTKQHLQHTRHAMQDAKVSLGELFVSQAHVACWQDSQDIDRGDPCV